MHFWDSYFLFSHFMPPKAFCFASLGNGTQEGAVFKKDSRRQKRPVLPFASAAFFCRVGNQGLGNGHTNTCDFRGHSELDNATISLWGALKISKQN